MAEPRNFANALLILAGIYVLISVELGTWAKIGVWVLLLFSFATWGHFHYPFKDDEKRLYDMKIESERQRALNFAAGTKQLLLQAEIIRRGLTPQ